MLLSLSLLAGGEADGDGRDECHDEHECEDLLFHTFLLMPQKAAITVSLYFISLNL